MKALSVVGVSVIGSGVVVLAQATPSISHWLDPTIHTSDLIIFGGGLLAFVKMVMMFRDELRDFKKALGSKDPETGLIGDVAEMQRTQQLHHEWLIRARLDANLRHRVEDDREYRRKQREGS